MQHVHFPQHSPRAKRAEAVMNIGDRQTERAETVMNLCELLPQKAETVTHIFKNEREHIKFASAASRNGDECRNGDAYLKIASAASRNGDEYLRNCERSEPKR